MVSCQWVCLSIEYLLCVVILCTIFVLSAVLYVVLRNKDSDNTIENENIRADEEKGEGGEGEKLRLIRIRMHAIYRNKIEKKEEKKNRCGDGLLFIYSTENE